MTAPCGETGTVTVACRRVGLGPCAYCGAPKPGSGGRPPRAAAAPSDAELMADLRAVFGWADIQTARVPDRSSSGATGAEPGPALQDAAGNFWPHPLTTDVPAYGRTGSHAPLPAPVVSGQGRPSPTRRPRSARTVRVPGRGPGPYATFDHWHDGPRVPDKPDEDRPGCPWDLLAFVAAVLLVFAVVVFCGWLFLKGSGVL